jgi:hypothetical protein
MSTELTDFHKTPEVPSFAPTLWPWPLPWDIEATRKYRLPIGHDYRKGYDYLYRKERGLPILEPTLTPSGPNWSELEPSILQAYREFTRSVQATTADSALPVKPV